MGRISRRKISPAIEERIFEIFQNYLVSLKDSRDVQEFLKCLLSYTEEIMVAKRLAIALLLRRGFNYEEIDETLKVSKSTIGTVHKQLLIGAEGYKKAVEKILKEEKQEKLWNRLEEIIIKLSPHKRYGSIPWQGKSKKGKEISKRKKQLSSL